MADSNGYFKLVLKESGNPITTDSGELVLIRKTMVSTLDQELLDKVELIDNEEKKGMVL